MAILRKIDGAGDVHPNIGLERGSLPGIEHLGGNSQLIRLRGVPGLLSERELRLAEHQQAAFHQAEVVVRPPGQFLKTGAAGKVQVAQQRRGTADVSGVRRAPEFPAPAQQIPIEPRPDVKGRFGVPHPFEPQRHHAGRGQRHEMARHDHARVAVGTTLVIRRAPVEHRDLVPFARGVVSCAQPNDAAADEDNVLHSSKFEAPNVRKIPGAKSQTPTTRSIESSLGGWDADARVSSRMVAADVRRRILARKTLPPRNLGGYGHGSCDDSLTHPGTRSCFGVGSL